MCGRISQYRSQQAYAMEIGWEDYAASLDFLLSAETSAHKARFNVPPGTALWTMHRFDHDKPRIDAIRWGYRAPWGKEKGLPMAINATVEKAGGAYWRNLWRSGRAIVPAEGWYEWTGEKGHKQPWFIRLRTDRPMFLAALARYRPDAAQQEEDSGLTIVTTASRGGMVDVHDRRPVVFSAEDAALWLDRSLAPAQAEQMARNLSLPESAFVWYQVSTAVNNARNDMPACLAPLPGVSPPSPSSPLTQPEQDGDDDVATGSKTRE